MFGGEDLEIKRKPLKIKLNHENKESSINSSKVTLSTQSPFKQPSIKITKEEAKPLCISIPKSSDHGLNRVLSNPDDVSKISSFLSPASGGRNLSPALI
jgi:hypothetical protein